MVQYLTGCSQKTFKNIFFQKHYSQAMTKCIEIKQALNDKNTAMLIYTCINFLFKKMIFIHLFQHSESGYQYIYSALMRFMVDQSQYGGELKIVVRDRTSRITLLTESNKLCVEN